MTICSQEGEGYNRCQQDINDLIGLRLPTCPICQERIGSGVGVMVLCRGGHAYCSVCYLKLRDRNPLGKPLLCWCRSILGRNPVIDRPLMELIDEKLPVRKPPEPKRPSVPSELPEPSGLPEPSESCSSVSPHKKTGPLASPDKKILKSDGDGCNHVLIMCYYELPFTPNALFIVSQV